MDQCDREMLRGLKEQNRLLGIIADELREIRKSLPLKRMIIPVLSEKGAGSSVWGVRELTDKSQDPGFSDLSLLSTEKKEEKENG
jgi:hypothetical protein